jgi:acyl-CoA dehydrogenase
LRRTVAAVKATNDPAFGATGGRLGEAGEDLARATAWLLARRDHEPEAALAGATPYLRLFALAAGGCMLADEALAALRLAGEADAAGRIATVRFFAENLATATGGLAATVTEGAASVVGADALT